MPMVITAFERCRMVGKLVDTLASIVKVTEPEKNIYEILEILLRK